MCSPGFAEWTICSPHGEKTRDQPDGERRVALEGRQPRGARGAASVRSVKDESGGAFDVTFAVDPESNLAAGIRGHRPVRSRQGMGAGAGRGDRSKLPAGHNFTINAGGDVLTADARHRAQLARRHPASVERAGGRGARGSELAVATSGRYERGEHIIAPSTGHPNGLMSVTCGRRSGYGRRLCHRRSRAGRRGPAWLAERGVAAAVIADDGTVTVTPELSDYRVS